uniref:Putative secreted protein n=1 Tax=Anopheles triannulatus TaxID=58253 RepID=A0A2M4B6T6_9DIPT
MSTICSILLRCGTVLGSLVKPARQGPPSVVPCLLAATTTSIVSKRCQRTDSVHSGALELKLANTHTPCVCAHIHRARHAE